MRHETWTRISFEGDDYFDIVESYDEVKRILNEANGMDLLEFVSVTGYRVTVRARNITSFYEHGIEIFKRIWEHSKELDDIKKQTVGWEES